MTRREACYLGDHVFSSLSNFAQTILPQRGILPRRSSIAILGFLNVVN